MRCIFDASGKVIKNFNSKIDGPFWKVVKFAVGLCKSVLNQVLILWISEFDSYKSLFLAILYIKMDVCLYLIQIHISEPIGTKLCTHLPRGLEETVGYVLTHNISPFPPFRPIFLRAGVDSRAIDGCPPHTTPLLHYIRDAACAGVTSCTVGCAMKTRRSERNACV